VNKWNEKHFTEIYFLEDMYYFDIRVEGRNINIYISVTFLSNVSSCGSRSLKSYTVENIVFVATKIIPGSNRIFYLLIYDMLFFVSNMALRPTNKHESSNERAYSIYIID
jgi:hypothetical protein